MAKAKKTKPMKPRPFYRWKSFWLGLFVLMFLGAQWEESIQCYRAAAWGDSSGRARMVVAQSDSMIMVKLRNARAPTRAIPPGFQWGVTPFVKENRQPWFPWPWYMESYEGWSLNCAVAHWLLILLFLVPWVGFLAWRVRRQRQQSETNA